MFTNTDFCFRCIMPWQSLKMNTVAIVVVVGFDSIKYLVLE
jgi:hypothetical protein